MSDTQQQMIPPDMPLSVTLTAMQWNTLNAMSTIAQQSLATLMGEIQRQCAQSAGLQPWRHRGNGAMQQSGLQAANGPAGLGEGGQE